MIQTQTQAVGHDLHALAEALLDDVEAVLSEFPDDALNELPKNFTNTPYALIYHLTGSARYWIGEVVGGEPSDRVRAEEFTAQGTRGDLETRLQDTRERLTHALTNLDERDLIPHPIDLSKGVLSWGALPPEGRTSVWVASHDLAHIAYHLGQLKLMRHALEGGE